MDTLTDLKFGMSVVIKVENDLRNVGLPQVAMHRRFHLFWFFHALRRNIYRSSATDEVI